MSYVGSFFDGVKCGMVRDNWQQIWYEEKGCDKSLGTCNFWTGEGVQAGFYDAVFMQYNPQRVAAYHYSDVVLGSYQLVAVAKKGHRHNHASFPPTGGRLHN